MAITAAKLRRCEIWSTWAAAGGVRQAVVNDATALTATSNIAGTDQLNLTLPLQSPALAFVIPGAVIRIEEADAVFDEWRIEDGPNDDDGSGLRSVQGLPIRAAMATCELIRRIDSDGTSLLDFESVGLTPAQQIAAWVIPALTRGGMAWIVAGTITPTKLLDLTFSNDTPLSVLQRIADQTEMELDIQRIVGGYQINIIAAVGSSAPVADLRFDKNLQPGTKRNRSSLESATRVYPFGASEDDRHATMSRATWQVTNIAGLVVTLADPAGGKGPIQFDGQLAGLNGTTAAYLRKPGGTLTAVTAASAANQTVTVASVASLAVNDLVQFRADSGGSDMLWLDSPPDQLLYGLKVGTTEMSDVPSTNNLLKNAVMRAWPGAPTSPPTNWTATGGGTVARQSASPFTRVGGFSIHRVGVADGDGVISDAVPIFPTALKPYVSGYAGLWVVSGRVRVELVFTTGGGPVVQPLPPDFATNSVLGQWEDLGAAGIDANALGATAVALRVVQHGATAADFYLDYGQVTDSPSQLPLAESSGGTRLWQAANEKLRTGGAPLVSYELKIVDLANIDPATWGADCKVVVGGTVRVTDPRLTIAITTRLVELTRDYKVWGDTAVKLSNKFDDITNKLANSFGPPRTPVTVSDGPTLKFAEALARITNSTATQVTVTVTANPASPAQQVQYVGVTGGATLASGTAPGTWVTPNGTNNVWVFNRAAINAGAGQAQFRAGNVTGFQNDDDLVSIEEQGRDTIALSIRARVIATTAKDVTVRVAVADPFPQGAASGTITYQNLGSGGVTPGSGGTVTPAATLTEAGGTFIDYLITRPPYSAGAGRVTFTGTAASRTSDSDAVDVPEKDRDFSTATFIASSGINLDGTTAEKTAFSALWDEQVRSVDGYTGGAFASAIVAPVVGASVFLALNTDPATDADYVGLDYAVQIHSDGLLYVHRSGVFEAPTVAYSAGDQIAIVYDGTTVRWLKNGTIFRESPVAAGIKFFFDSSFFNPGAKLSNIRFGPMSGNQGTIVTRARITATTPTTLTVRVAVADPVPQGAASATISYQDLGSGGVSPASGGTVTPAATLTEAAGTFIDYTVTRPAFGAGAGRVTFTGTAANRSSSSDAIDVPEVDRDTQSLSMRILRVSETADQIVVRVEVISPNAGATVTIAYNNGGLTVSPASGGTLTSTTSFGTTAHIDYTITRDTANGTPRKVTFTASAPGFVDTTDSVDVPITSTRFRAKIAQTISLANNSPTFFAPTSEISDIGNLHDNATNPSHITVPTGGDVGTWIVSGNVSFASNATGYRVAAIYKNGVLTDANVVVQAVAAGVLTSIPVTFVDSAPAVGDYYELLGTQTSGGALSTTGTLTATHLP